MENGLGLHEGLMEADRRLLGSGWSLHEGQNGGLWTLEGCWSEAGWRQYLGGF